MKPGIHSAIPSSDYHRRELGVVSKSALDLVRRSPAHYKAWIDGELPDDDTPALRFGRAFHMALLEPDRFASAYTELPKFDRRTKEGKAAAAAWEAEHAESEAILMDDLLRVTAMVDAVRAHPLAGKMIRDGKPELTLSWKDAGTGLRCKSRLDYYVEDLAMIVDVKTSENASHDTFKRDVVKYGYHRQDALYRAAALALDLPVQHFVLLAVEKAPPYAVACYSLDAEAIGLGYGSVRRDIETMADCLRKNRWPGYPETITELDLPPWAA